MRYKALWVLLAAALLALALRVAYRLGTLAQPPAAKVVVRRAEVSPDPTPDRAASYSNVAQDAAVGHQVAGRASAYSGCVPPSADELPLDDLEDGDSRTLPNHLLRGQWTAQTDPSTNGVFYPGPGPIKPEDSRDPCRRLAIHVKGHDFTQWGATFGIDFIGSGYNASAFWGISFWARTDAAEDQSLRVELPNRDTEPRGHVCVDPASGNDATQCYNHFSAVVAVGRRWGRVRVPFSELQRRESDTAFDPATVFALKFVAGDGGVPFDLWIDSVSLLKKEQADGGHG